MEADAKHSNYNKVAAEEEVKREESKDIRS